MHAQPADAPASLPAHTTFTRAGMLRGVRDCGALTVFMIPFSLAYGVAARDGGMSIAEGMFASAFVFAAASQFAALEIWGAQVSILQLFLIVFAVNARFILMGAALYEWLRPLPWYKRAWSVFFMTDANWAVSLAAREKGEHDFGHLVGGGIAFYLVWQVGSTAGLVFGPLIPDPRAVALDVVVLAFFAALLAGTWKGPRRNLAPWIAAAGVSLAVYYTLSTSWHVVAGGLAGGLVGAFQPGADAPADGARPQPAAGARTMDADHA